MELIFINNISKIKTHHKLKCVEFNKVIQVGKVPTEEKYFFGLFRKYKKELAVFTRLFGADFLCTIEEYNKENKESYIENGKFYYKPFCIIYTNDGNNTEKFFSTSEELDKYVDSFKHYPHITIN